MTKQDEEKMWRDRFILIQLTRIGGTIVALMALLLWQSDTFVEGGSIIGLPVALAGLVASFWGPLFLARRWRTPPEA